MKNKVIAITTRFGDLPKIFPLWLKSIKINLEFDFLIITDQSINEESENLHVIKYESLNDFIKFASLRLEYDIKIDTPFKSADLRPAYLDIFCDEIERIYVKKYKKQGSFDFCGYLDMDMILGKLNNFINDDILDNCDMFQTWGHFSLIRNNNQLRKLYMKKYKNYDFFKSLSLPENCMLEEGPFVLQVNNEGLRIDSKVSRIADIKRNSFKFKIDGNNYENQFFCYKNGKIIQHYIENNRVKENEFMYIHFMKRVIYPFDISCNNYILTENGFFNLFEDVNQNNITCEKAFKDWNKFTNVIKDERYKKVSLLYKVMHLNMYLYRKKVRQLEFEKREMNKKIYEQ